jgi:hypothetical protein
LVILGGLLRWLGSQLPDEIQNRDEWKVEIVTWNAST